MAARARAARAPVSVGEGVVLARARVEQWSIVNSVNWQYGWAEGALEVTQWDDFVDELAGYPVLEWCRAAGCVLGTTE
jgi:hypothetical protein